MTDAEKAYVEAERLIEEAREEGAVKLDLNWVETHALETLPPQIAELTGLTFLELNNTNISDIAPLANLSALTELYLSNTQVSDFAPLANLSALTELGLNSTPVSDIAPLANLSALTELYLSNTQVSDFAPLANLSALRLLGLSNTQVSDIAPLANLSALRMLYLNSTPVSDIAPLANLSALTELGLSNTQVSDIAPLANLSALAELYLEHTQVGDLRPLRSLTSLAEPKWSGLTFKNCTAAQSDPRITEIAEIEDPAERAQTLFDYLETWTPPGEVADADDSLAPPAAQTAPLQPEVQGGRLRRSDEVGLPEQDAMARAEAGWQALKTYRDAFGQSCNVHNYAQLSAILAAFDAALGDAFDPEKTILIASMGSALVALSEDEEFCAQLPTGAAPLLVQFGVQIETYVNRFPDWIRYKEDALKSTVTVATVSAETALFKEIEEELRNSEETDVDVADDYALQVTHGTKPDSDPIVATGLVASTRETARALAEAGIESIRSGEIAQSEIEALDKVHDSELARVKWYAGGFAIVMLRRRSPALRRLARTFPAQLGWLNKVLDYLGGDQ